LNGTPAFTCPCCGAVSHNKTDVEQGYCARCWWWTGDPQLGRDHLAGLCEMRVNPEFAAFKEEMAEMVMDTCEVPEDQRDLWRDLRAES
jgi:hypothetical protein